MTHMVRAEFEGAIAMFPAEIPAAVGDTIDLVRAKLSGQFKVTGRRLEYTPEGPQVEVLILRKAELPAVIAPDPIPLETSFPS